MLAVLTGGTGGAKLIQGLSYEIDPAALTLICNTADDFVLHGLYVSPDIDTIMYSLAGIGDEVKGWGVRGDTFAALEQFEKYGCESWFKLGDKDLATHITRTRLLREGLKLSAVTDRLCSSLGLTAKILPMSDDRVETRVQTFAGEISFQEYFVKERWQPEVKRVYYAGSETCRPAPGAIEAIEQASAVIICPSNPVTSIGPILATPGIRKALVETEASVIGVSPIIGQSAVSGPAHKLMSAMDAEPSAAGVARTYADFVDVFLIDREDDSLRSGIEALGITVVPTSILMNSLSAKRRLAREVMALVAK
ncbi:MAG TPA: 2-phospho-L-lactate transferase [Candidatus Binatia bacterium]|nr:2-phospho-L-lactate transferase [Candidatus Binatia bacterium]